MCKFSISVLTAFFVLFQFSMNTAQADPDFPLEGDSEAVLFDDMLVEKSALPEGLSTFGAVKLRAELWEDGVIPVQFPAGTTQEEKDLFMQACGEWTRVANVKCIEGSYKGRKLRVFHEKLGCFSLYGMGTNFFVLRRIMNLQRAGCWSKSTIIHELGHAFGLIHEHQRPDRDQFVEIHTENANGGFLGLNIVFNFWELGARPLTPYDFFSIMHYSRKMFSKDGKDTIVPRPEYMPYLDVIGTGSTVSRGDALTLSALYGPPKAGVR